jgi:uncharacterized protein DUF3224
LVHPIRETAQGRNWLLSAAGGPAVTILKANQVRSRVNGTLKGRAGSFTLQHSGTISNGVQQLLIIVVPGSGTGQLEGISGKMTINIAGGMHSYDLEYALPKTD